MPETLTKLVNLNMTVRASARIVLRGHSGRRAASGSRTRKGFVEIKPVAVAKQVES